MIESIRFSSVLPFGKGEREGFVSFIWRYVADRWGEDFSSEIEARIQMEIDTFERIEGYMAYLYFVWRVVIDKMNSERRSIERCSFTTSHSQSLDLKSELASR